MLNFFMFCDGECEIFCFENQFFKHFLHNAKTLFAKLNSFLPIATSKYTLLIHFIFLFFQLIVKQLLLT